MVDATQRLLAGDHRALSRLLSLLERGNSQVGEVLKSVDRHTGHAYIVGITGPPGAGKSTILDQLTRLLRGQGNKIGIIAVDPTSPFTGGALLGDRVRMQRHYLDPGVFIRSVATRGQSGGLPRIVKGMVRLLDAAGMDLVLVETVGVGQTELGIMEVADTVVVTLMPESGDAIQTLKAGVLEIADVYLVNKADRDGADRMATAITGTLHLTPAKDQWVPPVLLTTASSGEGIDELWASIQDHQHYLMLSSKLADRRKEQRRREFLETVEEELGRRLKTLVEQEPSLTALLERVALHEAEPYSAAMEFLDSVRLPRDWTASPSTGQG
jgi:LAO/AO transport system kinase